MILVIPVIFFVLMQVDTTIMYSFAVCGICQQGMGGMTRVNDPLNV